jgi:mannose-6-phosphate isomerase-like protein (cupin superfamily)
MEIPTAHGTSHARPSHSVLGIGYSLLVSSQQTGGAYELMLFLAPAGHGPPPHVHRHEDELFYILEGEFDVLFGERTLHVRPGDYIHLPRGTPHAFRNTTNRNASFLCWVTPGTLGPFFDAFQRDWPADQALPPPVGEEDINKLMAAAARHEIQILGG